MLRLWLASTGSGLLLASFEGLSLSDPYLYEIVIHGAVAMAAGWLLVVLGALRLWVLSLMVAGGLPLAMRASQAIIMDNVKPTNAHRRVTREIPVGLRTWMEDNALYGEITSHSGDWLRLAIVQCQMVYADGTPSNVVHNIAVGSGIGWYRIGESHRQRLLVGNGMRVAPGMDLSRTRCRVTSADFYEDPPQKPSFTMYRDPRTQFYVFKVFNNQDRPISGVKFSCWVQYADRQHKENFTPLAFYEDGWRYSIRPKSEARLYIPQSFAARELTRCIVYGWTWDID